VIVGLFFALAYSVGVSNTERKLRAEHNAERYSEGAASRIEANCLILDTPKAVAECTENEVKAAEEARRGEYDLTAQQDMADWAFWLLWVSVGSVAIGTVGVVFVWLSLGHTQSSAKAAQDSAAVALKSMEVEQRPWIEIVNVVLSDDRKASRPAGGSKASIPVVITLKNHGKTPAEYIFTFAQIGPFETFEFINKAKDRATRIMNGGYNPVLFPNQEVQIKIDRGRTEDLTGLSLDGKIIFRGNLFCSVFYIPASSTQKPYLIYEITQFWVEMTPEEWASPDGWSCNVKLIKNTAGGTLLT
jgi:hypothetical protein